MKKQIFGIAALSLLFVATSCSDETRESGNDLKDQISFRTALGKQTKAAEFTDADWQIDDRLTVNAYPVNSTVLTNTFTLTYDGAAWGYGTPFNQPGYALRYYSYYPATNVSNAAVITDSYKFDYVIEALAADQKDLIAASANTNSAVVTLPFSHILSQVNFALTKIPGVKIKITTDISVIGVKSSGTYTFGAATPWAPVATPATYVYKPLTGTNITDGTTGGTSYMGNGHTDRTKDNALMLMPQSFEAEADGTFSFAYSLTPVKSDGTDDTPITGTVTANLCDFELSTWAPGKRYLYVIDFSAFLAGGPITFTVSISPWEDATPYLAAETLYVADATKVSIEAAIAKHSTANAEFTVFPIAVAEDLTATLEIATIPGFQSADEIRIEFPTNAGASFLSLSASLAADWDLAVAVAGRVVTLTKK